MYDKWEKINLILELLDIIRCINCELINVNIDWKGEKD